jgi:hypothetical protein
MSSESGDTPKNVIELDFASRKVSQAHDSASNALSHKKVSVFRHWIEQGIVMLTIDARRSDVKVPEEFRELGDLKLNFSFGYHIPDFNFNDVGVWATLSFEDGLFFCMIPWTAVYAMQSEGLKQGALWFEDFPSDLDPEEILGFDPRSVAMEVEDETEVEENMPLINETSDKNSNILSFDFTRKNIIE